jgi:hypothetical protein
MENATGGCHRGNPKRRVGLAFTFRRRLYTILYRETVTPAKRANVATFRINNLPVFNARRYCESHKPPHLNYL